MFSWFKKFFTKSKKSSCCSKNTCGSANVWNKPQPYIDTNDSLVDVVVVNTVANSICMDQGHPMCCPSKDSSSVSDSGSCCGGSVSDSPSCFDSDCSSSCDSGSSCCGSDCSSSD